MSNLTLLGTRIQLPNIWNDNDALAIFCKRSNTHFLKDRFGYLNQFSKYNISSHFDKLPNTNYCDTLENIMLGRANEIYEITQQTNKKVYVLWSGGIDSTAILLSLLEVFDNVKDIGVIHTNSSIIEYPIFYNFLKTIQIELIKIDGNKIYETWYDISQKNYVVSGYPADQLFGSVIHQAYPAWFFKDWKDFISENIAIQQFESAFSYYGLPIKTFGEFAWFMNFSTRWGMVNRDVLCHIGKQEAHTINFFDTQEFQDWSLSNFDRLHIYDQKDNFHYKLELKEFCNKYFPDKDYLHTKGKVDSTVYAKKLSNEEAYTVPFVAVIEGYDTIKCFRHNYITNNKERYKSIGENLLKNVLKKYRRE